MPKRRKQNKRQVKICAFINLYITANIEHAFVGWQCKIFSLSIILYHRQPGNNKEERDLVNKFSGLSIKSCDTKLSEDALDILTHNLSHNVLSKEVKLKHLYKLP